MLNFGGQKLKGGGQNLNPKMQKMKGREIGEIPKKNWVLSLVLRPLPEKSASEASVCHNPIV